MAYTWTNKTVYIRETTDGKTRWVKLDGVVARRSRHGIINITLDEDYEEHSIDTYRDGRRRFSNSSRFGR